MKSSRILAAIMSLAVIAATLAATPGTTGATDVRQINNLDRRDVAISYRDSVQTNLNVSSQWNGSTSSCNPGTSSASFDAATVETLNWFRSMAGLSNVTEDPSQSAAAQRAALMMQAQGQLSHSPSTGWNCYTSAGASAAQNSNLTLGVSGASGVVGQIEDPGASNTALGHRRWLLFPRLKTVGIGNTSAASSIQVVNDFGSRASENSWVQWPPPGFVPGEMVFDRWSLSYAGQANVDLSNARVSVVENGRSLGVTLLPFVNGFGDPTLAFEVPSANPTAVGDNVYRVRVTGIVQNGQAVERSYVVTAFDARAALFSCDGQSATIVGTSGSDTINGTQRSDVIVGLGGNDRINGLSGNDTICSGAGNDNILGGNGNDALFGQDGVDVLVGGLGNDALVGGTESDSLFGNAGSDQLNGGPGTDVCWGEGGNSTSRSSDSRVCENGR